jgi:hypothetical protein
MYESPKPELIEIKKGTPVYKTLRIINVLMLASIGILIAKTILFFGMDIRIGFRLFLSAPFALMAIPYILCLKCFGSPPRMRKPAIILSVISCLFIATGTLIGQQQNTVYLIWGTFFLVNIINIFFLLKLGSAKSANNDA